MNLYKKIIKNEVFMAMGCTEPASCAYCAALAAETLGEPFETLHLFIDPGTLKNGSGVVVPFSKGQKGNLIAAVLGALIANSQKELQLLSDVTDEHLAQAKQLISSKACEVNFDIACHDLHIEVTLQGAHHSSRCLLKMGHTRVHLIERDGVEVFREKPSGSTHDIGYRSELGRLSFSDLLQLIENLDQEDRDYIQQGITMNLALSQAGRDLKMTAFQLETIKQRGYLAEDVFFKTKIAVAAAIDARMSGMAQGAMTSGGSGNQGIVTVLVCYLVGKELNIAEEKIIQSIALAHVINSYTKSYLGELSAMCGCAMSSGLAASVALIYQKLGPDLHKMNLAVNNIIGDLSGLICDGAKPGCAFKAVTSVDSALRAFFMAAEGFGLTMDDGLLGHSAQQSIANMSKVTLEGMFKVDLTVLEILQRKSSQ